MHLIDVEQVSSSTYRQIVAALKFLYTVTLSRAWVVERIPFPRNRRPRLAKVLRADQIVQLFAALRRPKYRVLLMTCYAAGLRISEACRLRVEDIDSRRMVIRVQYGKGNKQRYTVLSPRLLAALREYWKTERPMEWLFTGQGASGHVTPRTFWKTTRTWPPSRRCWGTAPSEPPRPTRTCGPTTSGRSPAR